MLDVRPLLFPVLFEKTAPAAMHCYQLSVCSVHRLAIKISIRVGVAGAVTSKIGGTSSHLRKRAAEALVRRWAKSGPWTDQGGDLFVGSGGARGQWLAVVVHLVGVIIAHVLRADQIRGGESTARRAAGLYVQCVECV